MKIRKLAYFCDRNQIGELESKFLFLEEFNKLGVEVDFLTSKGGSCNLKKSWIQKRNLKIKWVSSWDIKYSRLFFKKFEDNYDALLISSVKAKEQSKRDQIIKIFKKSKKKVFQICDSNCFDHKIDERADKYFFPSKTLASYFIPKKRSHDTEITGTIFSPHHISKKFLTKGEFYKKYNIDPSRKIIAVYPTRTDRFKVDTLSDKKTYKFLTNLENINSILNKKGYELILKLHRFEYFGRKTTNKDYKNKNFPKSMTKKGLKAQKFFWPSIKYIDDENFCELINYSEGSISILTSLTFFHHLFRKPTFYVAKNIGIHIPKGIISKDKSDYQNTLKGLIFGDDLKPYIGKDIELVEFLLEQIKTSRFDSFVNYNKNKHPITGNFKESNLRTTAELLIKKIY